MYELELFGMLLFLSFIVSFILFAFLFVHSLIEERREEASQQVNQPEPTASHVRRPAPVSSPSLAADLAND